MSDTLVMNSLNLGVSPKVGESVYFPPSQKAIKENAAEGAADQQLRLRLPVLRQPTQQ